MYDLVTHEYLPPQCSHCKHYMPDGEMWHMAPLTMFSGCSFLLCPDCWNMRIVLQFEYDVLFVQLVGITFREWARQLDRKERE